MAGFTGPPPAPRRRREIGAIRGIRAPDRVGERATGGAAADDGRIVRVAAVTAAEARVRLARWAAEGGARTIAAPGGVQARERRVADRLEPGAERLQRIAVATAGEVAAVAHWSVSVPPTPADERAWTRALERLGEGSAPGGWAA